MKPSKDKIIGVYIILHLPTCKVYFGVSKNCKEKKVSHKYDLCNNRNKNKNLQKDYNDSPLVEFRIIKEFSDIESALNYKQKMLDLYNGNPKLKSFLYNRGTDVRLPSKGLTHSDETRTKISVSVSKTLSGRKLSVDHKRNVAESRCKSIIIDGVYYTSIIKASRLLNINKRTIGYRLQSPYFPNYYYITDE